MPPTGDMGRAETGGSEPHRRHNNYDDDDDDGIGRLTFHSCPRARVQRQRPFPLHLDNHDSDNNVCGDFTDIDCFLLSLFVIFRKHHVN